MSIKVTSLIWECGPFDGSTLLVMLALGDWANDEGVAWPAVERIARKARCCERTAQSILAELTAPNSKSEQWLKVEKGGGRRRTNRYRINLVLLAEYRKRQEEQAEKSAEVAPFVPGKGAEVAPLPPGNGAIQCTETVQPSAGNGAAVTAPEPKEPPPEPSLFGAGAPVLATGREAKAEKPDPRYRVVVEAIRRRWPEGVPFAFTPADGKAVKELLQRAPEAKGWTAARLAECVAFRFASDWTNPTESVKAWARALTDFASGPQDAYHAPRLGAGQLEAARRGARQILGLEQVRPEEHPAAKTTGGVEIPPAGCDGGAWRAVLEKLEKQINRHSFETWLKPTRGRGIVAGVLYVQVPTPEFRVIGEKYGEQIRAAMQGAAVAAERVQFVVTQ